MSTRVEPEIYKLFRTMEKYNASDLHLKADSPPILRIAGTLRKLELPPLTGDQVRDLVYEILSEKQVGDLDRTGSVDLAHGFDQGGRVRINTFRQRGVISFVARRVNTDIPPFEKLHLPGDTLRRIADLEDGLVIVAGITGSGKSTTLAAMVEFINVTRRCHIVTIEDPIEYFFSDKKSYINQREVGLDVESFQSALRYVLRQDPDVIVLGEMRDAETVQTALTAAETGHLVFGTLHASTVPQVISRILDLFPGDRGEQIRMSLEFNLRAVICQKLLPSIRKDLDRVPAIELMLVNPIIKKLIRSKEEEKIAQAIRSGQKEGMIDFTTSLVQLVKQQYIDKAVALTVAPNADLLQMNLQGIFLDEGRGIIN
ncbi:MAG: PilT/PilU family type 4a pilus ATPase [Planctomycetes bacterium]|nr:PilT/PilU family type 4a pilus ATPase [Planctomycetota bacterium]